MPRVWDIPVRDSTRVRDARVAAEQAAALAGLDESRTAAAALVATELATNLLKHAEGGQVLIDVVDPPVLWGGGEESRVVQITAIDHGPGIPDVPAAVRDGFSTTRSLGAGLGTCLRLADDFGLDSAPGRGTVAVARVGSTPRGGAVPAGAAVAAWPEGPSAGRAAADGDPWTGPTAPTAPDAPASHDGPWPGGAPRAARAPLAAVAHGGLTEHVSRVDAGDHFRHAGSAAHTASGNDSAPDVRPGGAGTAAAPGGLAGDADARSELAEGPGVPAAPGRCTGRSEGHAAPDRPTGDRVPVATPAGSTGRPGIRTTPDPSAGGPEALAAPGTGPRGHGARPAPGGIAAGGGPGRASGPAGGADGVPGGSRGAAARAVRDVPVPAGSGPLARVRAGGVNIPYGGAEYSGDAWTWVRAGERVTLMLADGLGHGPEAARASSAAVAALHRWAHLSPAEALRHLHDALRGTRGAAVAVAQLDLRAGRLTFAGIGNVGARLRADGSWRPLLSRPGIVGVHRPTTLREEEAGWAADRLLILHTDGLPSRWTPPSGDIGAPAADPAVTAAVTIRDASSPARPVRDDTAVAVLTPTPPERP